MDTRTYKINCAVDEKKYTQPTDLLMPKSHSVHSAISTSKKIFRWRTGDYLVLFSKFRSPVSATLYTFIYSVIDFDFEKIEKYISLLPFLRP